MPYRNTSHVGIRAYMKPELREGYVHSPSCLFQVQFANTDTRIHPPTSSCLEVYNFAQVSDAFTADLVTSHPVIRPQQLYALQQPVCLSILESSFRDPPPSSDGSIPSTEYLPELNDPVYTSVAECYLRTASLSSIIAFSLLEEDDSREPIHCGRQVFNRSQSLPWRPPLRLRSLLQLSQVHLNPTQSTTLLSASLSVAIPYRSDTQTLSRFTSLSHKPSAPRRPLPCPRNPGSQRPYPLPNLQSPAEKDWKYTYNP